MKTSRYSKGLTLAELMTVLAIMALSLVLAAPYIGQYLDDRKVRNVAESIFYGMQIARLRAVQTNVQTQFELTGTQWAISQINMATLTPVIPALETFDWGRSWSSVSVVPSTNTVVTFDGMGRVMAPDVGAAYPPSPPSQLDVSGRPGGRALRVVVNGGSSVRVCDPQLPSSDPKGC